jgi:hypothetical protein
MNKKCDCCGAYEETFRHEVTGLELCSCCRERVEGDEAWSPHEFSRLHRGVEGGESSITFDDGYSVLIWDYDDWWTYTVLAPDSRWLLKGSDNLQEAYDAVLGDRRALAASRQGS